MQNQTLFNIFDSHVLANYMIYVHFRNSGTDKYTQSTTNLKFAAQLVCLNMAIYEIFSHAELRRYKTHIASKATLVQIICALLTFIPPLIIAYRSEGRCSFERLRTLIIYGTTPTVTLSLTLTLSLTDLQYKLHYHRH